MWSRPRATLAIALAAAAALLAANAWNGSLLGSDDAVYAQVAREAVAPGGSPLDPTWHGRPFLEKGPVLFAALGASIAALGETGFALRLPGILAGLALLAGAYALARAAGLSRGAALGGAAFLLAANAFYFNARRPMTDVPATALATWGLAALAWAGWRRPAAGAVAAGALLGLSALAKVTAPVPFVIAAVALRRFRDLAIAAAVAVAVALPWHVWMWARHGDAFLDTYVLYHVVARAGTAVVGQGGAGVYLDWLIERDAIAAVLLASALVAVVVLRAGSRALPLALLAASLLPLLAARTALPHYLVGALPAAALLVASASEGALARSRLAAPLLAIAIAASFLASNLRDLADPDHGPGAKAACSEAGPEVRFAFDLHDPALDWYCGREVPILAADEDFAAALAGIPMLRGHVRPATPEALAGLARTGGLLVTRPDRLHVLESLASRAGLRVEAREFGARVVAAVTRR
ncbi:MAG: glycosyltransferase family 39 protein [Deltaproteobacteria bacterium]|nr:glycosyltransferase family 39 protein [Deltaproteobacteria bacterium]